MAEQPKPSPKPEPRGASLATKLKIAAIGLIALLVIIVVFQNTEPVRTKLLFMEVTMPAALLLLMTMIIGFAIGVLVTGAIYRKRAK